MRAQLTQTQVTSATMSTTGIIRGMYPQDQPAVERYLGTVGPFVVYATSEADAVGTCYEVFDLWHQEYDASARASGNPTRVARLTGAEGRALAELLKRPG